jgi:hypothetical protein
LSEYEDIGFDSVLNLTNFILCKVSVKKEKKL